MQKKPTKLVVTCVAGNGAFAWPSKYNFCLLIDFLKKHFGKQLRLTLEVVSGSKTEEALGYWWGVLLPAIIATNKKLHYEDETIGELLKKKEITPDEIEDMHCTLLTEFAPQFVTRLDGTKEKQRGEMKNMNNEQLLILISKVVDWFEENYAKTAPNPEEYKAVRDGAREAKEKINYPIENYQPTAFD